MVLGKKEMGDYLGTIIYKYKENIPNHLLSFYLVQSKDFPKPGLLESPYSEVLW